MYSGRSYFGECNEFSIFCELSLAASGKASCGFRAAGNHQIATTTTKVDEGTQLDLQWMCLDA